MAYPEWNGKTTFLTISANVGLTQERRTHAAVLTITASILIFVGMQTANLRVFVYNDDLVNDANFTSDFLEKGTLSNVCQDVATARGRLFTTSLVVASFLLLFSEYPMWIYRVWAPWWDELENPLRKPILEAKKERWHRIAWLILPNVGFILTGLIPSKSDPQGLDKVLTAVHFAAAPIAMAYLMIMEMVQLEFGEKVITRFRQGKRWVEPRGWPHPGEPLTMYQKIRMVLLILAWLFGFTFIGLQVYIQGGKYFVAGFKNQNRVVAQLSYWMEVTCLTLAFTLPAVNALEVITVDRGTIREQADDIVRQMATMVRPRKAATTLELTTSRSAETSEYSSGSDSEGGLCG